MASGTSSNIASTVASSSLWRMMSELPRSPEIKPERIENNRFTRAGFAGDDVQVPAPTPAPPASITAKFLIRSSRSIG